MCDKEVYSYLSIYLSIYVNISFGNVRDACELINHILSEILQ